MSTKRAVLVLFTHCANCARAYTRPSRFGVCWSCWVPHNDSPVVASRGCHLSSSPGSRTTAPAEEINLARAHRDPAVRYEVRFLVYALRTQPASKKKVDLKYSEGTKATKCQDRLGVRDVTSARSGRDDGGRRKGDAGPLHRAGSRGDQAVDAAGQGRPHLAHRRLAVGRRGAPCALPRRQWQA